MVVCCWVFMSLLRAHRPVVPIVRSDRRLRQPVGAVHVGGPVARGARRVHHLPHLLHDSGLEDVGGAREEHVHATPRVLGAEGDPNGRLGTKERPRPGGCTIAQRCSRRGLSRRRKNRAGQPATTAPGSTLRVTTAPAPTIAPSLMVTPGRMTAPLPIDAPRQTRVGINCQSASVCRAPSAVVARGSMSLVKMTP